MSKKIASMALLVTLITFVSKAFGFARDIIIASTYGATINSDAFFMAQSITGIVTSIILAALGTTFVPVMSDYIVQQPKERTNYFLNNVYSVSLIVTFIICLLGIIFADPLVSIFAPDFSLEAHNLTVQLVKILFPMVILTAILVLDSAKLQNHGNYLVPAAVGFPLNISVILIIIFFSRFYGIYTLAISLVIGTMIQVLCQVPYTKRLGYKFKPTIDLNEEGLRKIGTLLIPIMIGSGIQQINTMVDRIMASGLPTGSIAALNFSNRFSQFVVGILSAAIGSVYYTSMSQYFSLNNEIMFKKMLKNTINISALLIIPASVGLMVLKSPIVKLIFERGVFDSKASEMTATALFYYTIGLVGFLLRDVISRAFYALKDTKTAMVNGSISLILNIVLSIILIKYLELGGLALASSISGITGTILLLFSLKKKIGDFGIREILVCIFKISIASVVMAIMLNIIYNQIRFYTGSQFASLLISITCGFFVYTLLVFFMKIEEIESLKRSFFVFLKKLQKKDK